MTTKNFSPFLILIIFSFVCFAQQPEGGKEAPRTKRAVSKPTLPAPVEAGLRPVSADKESISIPGIPAPESIYFDFDKAEIKTNAYQVLDEIAEFLRQKPDAKIEITGHTDNFGPEDYNLLLSELRAIVVSDYFQSLGLKPEQFIVKGLGETSPLASNKTQEGRAKNRRVEFSLTPSPSSKESVENPEKIESVNGTLQPVSRTQLSGTFSAIDKHGNPFRGLTSEDVSAILRWSDKENNNFSTEGKVNVRPLQADYKLAVTLTMDYSPSMWDDNLDYMAPKTKRILEMENGVKTFINSLRESDVAKIIKFGTRIDIVQDYTSEKFLLERAIENECFPRSGTALFASIFAALKDTTFDYDPSYVKTVIAFTDGEENSSYPITKESVLNKAGLSGIRVSTIGLLLQESKHSDPPGQNSIFERDLVDIASKTGGFYYYAPRPEDLEKIYSSIISEMLNSYSVSIVWQEEKLPPPGTVVTAIITIKYKNQVKGFTREYVMQ